MKKKRGQSKLPPWLIKTKEGLAPPAENAAAKKAGGKADAKNTGPDKAVTCPKCGNVFVPKP